MSSILELVSDIVSSHASVTSMTSDDLVQEIQGGIPGTSMISFLLSLGSTFGSRDQTSICCTKV
jgi:hypothetical protein